MITIEELIKTPIVKSDGIDKELDDSKMKIWLVILYKLLANWGVTRPVRELRLRKSEFGISHSITDLIRPVSLYVPSYYSSDDIAILVTVNVDCINNLDYPIELIKCSLMKEILCANSDLTLNRSNDNHPGYKRTTKYESTILNNNLIWYGEELLNNTQNRIRLREAIKSKTGLLKKKFKGMERTFDESIERLKGIGCLKDHELKNIDILWNTSKKQENYVNELTKVQANLVLINSNYSERTRMPDYVFDYILNYCIKACNSDLAINEHCTQQMYQADIGDMKRSYPNYDLAEKWLATCSYRVNMMDLH